MPSRKLSKSKSQSSKDQAYCMKCKKKVTPADFKKTTSKNGRNMMRGTCPHCSTNVVAFC